MAVVSAAEAGEDGPLTVADAVGASGGAGDPGGEVCGDVPAPLGDGWVEDGACVVNLTVPETG